MSALVIIGTGGNAYDILDVVDACVANGQAWTVRGFLDDNLPAGARHLGLPILGSLERAGILEDCSFVNAVGSDRSYRLRPRISERIGLPPTSFATLVHPNATVSKPPASATASSSTTAPASRAEL